LYYIKKVIFAPFQRKGIPLNPGTVPAAVKLLPKQGYLQSATAVRWEGKRCKSWVRRPSRNKTLL